MGFANRKRDDHGHVIGNDERDGQPCQHGAGGSSDNVKKTKMASGTLYEYPNGERKMVSDEEKAFSEGKTVPADEKGSGWKKTKMASGILYEGPNGEREMQSDPFDDDYDEEFEETDIDKAGHILADPEEYIGKSAANRLERLMNDKNYKVGTMEELIAGNLADGMSNAEALDTAIESLENNLYEEDDYSLEEVKDNPDEFDLNNRDFRNKFSDTLIPIDEKRIKESREARENRIEEMRAANEEYNRINQIGIRLKENDADSYDGYLTHDEYNDVVAYAAKHNLSKEDLEKMGFGDYSEGIAKDANSGKQKKQESQNPPMTKEQRQAIRDQINKMVASLDDARSLDEAWDIEEGIKELEDMLKKYKGK